MRKALKLDQGNVYLLGQSWGGILAMEYALKYQQNIKGLIISNMVPSIPAYNQYARRVLMPAMDQKALAEQNRSGVGRQEQYGNNLGKKPSQMILNGPKSAPL